MKSNLAMFIVTLNTQVQFEVMKRREISSPKDSILFGYTKELLGVCGKKERRGGQREKSLKLNLWIRKFEYTQ